MRHRPLHPPIPPTPTPPKGLVPWMKPEKDKIFTLPLGDPDQTGMPRSLLVLPRMEKKELCV